MSWATTTRLWPGPSACPASGSPCDELARPGDRAAPRPAGGRGRDGGRGPREARAGDARALSRSIHVGHRVAGVGVVLTAQLHQVHQHRAHLRQDHRRGQPGQDRHVGGLARPGRAGRPASLWAAGGRTARPRTRRSPARTPPSRSRYSSGTVSPTCVATATLRASTRRLRMNRSSGTTRSAICRTASRCRRRNGDVRTTAIPSCAADSSARQLGLRGAGPLQVCSASVASPVRMATHHRPHRRGPPRAAPSRRSSADGRPARWGRPSRTAAPPRTPRGRPASVRCRRRRLGAP